MKIWFEKGSSHSVNFDIVIAVFKNVEDAKKFFNAVSRCLVPGSDYDTLKVYDLIKELGLAKEDIVKKLNYDTRRDLEEYGGELYGGITIAYRDNVFVYIECDGKTIPAVKTILNELKNVKIIHLDLYGGCPDIDYNELAEGIAKSVNELVEFIRQN